MDLGSSAASCRPNLPNVILLGDSITRNYFPQVTKDLGAIANVYLLASSTSVGDARLPQQIAEFAYLQGVSFAVVHFNNGLHGWSCTEAQFKTISDISPSDSGTTRARQAHLVYDQHALMTPHPELYEDAFHFNKAGSAMMSVQTAAIIRRVLEDSEH